MPADVFDTLEVDSWRFIEDIAGEAGTLTRAIEERTADIAGLKKFSEEVRGEIADGETTKLLGRAIAAERLINTLETEPSISFLSAKGVLPKYGFPIDTVSLDILSGDTEEAKKIDLSRDLGMAIAEFAPPAQVVANGKVWSSYAINIVPDKGWPAYIYYDCPKCKRLYPPEVGMVDATVDLSEEGKKECSCGTMMDPKKFIIPVFGFSTQMGEKPKMVGENKPSAYYVTQTQFWEINEASLTEKQKKAKAERNIDLKGKVVHISYSPGGRLFVLNQGNNGRGLRICPSCGYTSDPTKILRAGKHDTKFKKGCSCRNFIRASLGHHFSTDILRISLPFHPVNVTMAEGASPKNQDVSVLYAILEGASSALDISREDINGCVSGDGSIILFDDTAGGSGFVKNIYENFDKVLREARNKVAGQCECAEETSCYGCLRNYSNQYYHDELSRGLAYKYINWLLDGKVEVDSIQNTPFISPAVNTSQDEETIGQKKSHYIVPDTSANKDTVTQLEDLLCATDDEGVKVAYMKLIECAQGKITENPITDDKIDVDASIWPEIFWGKSHVALFQPSELHQYNILKKYDWYCYLLDESINPERVFSHIKGGDN